MAKEKLTKLCKEYGIPSKEISSDKLNFYRCQRYNEETLIQFMIDLDQMLNGNLISIGGFSASSKVLGFRPMRVISNDLDCITNEEGVALLNNHFRDKIYQTDNYGDLFLEYKNVPVGFDVDETHGWRIPFDFFIDVRRFSFPQGSFNSISSEYLIGLKARRSISKKKFYGKDALDTINILLAPFFREDLRKIDHYKLGEILKEHSSSSFKDIEEYLNFIGSYEQKVKKNEIPLLKDSLTNLKKHIKQIYFF